MVGKRLTGFSIMFMVLLGMATVSASAFNLPRSAVNTTNMLEAAYGQVSCKTNFTNSFVGGVIQNTSNTTLTQQVSAINNYSSELHSAAIAGNVSQYRFLILKFYDPSLNGLRDNVKKALFAYVRSSGSNRSTVINNLKTSYNTSFKQFTDCQSSSVKSLALQKVSTYKNELAAFQSVTSNLSSKGVDTSGMEAVLSNASVFVSQFSTAVNDSTNSSQIRSAYLDYCLFDGCQGGSNFHLDAKFALAKLQAITVKISANQSSVNQSVLANINSNLSSASSLLATVGKSPYTSQQATQLWNYLANAVKLLKHIV